MDEIKRTVRTVKISSNAFKYRGSIFWLIVFVIIFFPIAILLLLKNLARVKNNTTTYLEYSGSWKWVLFWGVICFPIAFILLFLNGLSLIEETREIVNTKNSDEDMIIDRRR